MRIERFAHLLPYSIRPAFQRWYSENEDWKMTDKRIKSIREYVSKVILRKWGLKDHDTGNNRLIFRCFKGDTQKMRIESKLYHTTSLVRSGFKGDTQKMRIESLLISSSSPPNFVSKVILRKWGLKDTWRIDRNVSTTSFQRSYSENEDWKWGISQVTIIFRDVSKVVLRKWGLKESREGCSAVRICWCFKGDTQKMRIESLVQGRK